MKSLLALIVFAALHLTAAAQETNPMADPAAVVDCGNARFTVLTPQMVRIQYSDKKLFEDRAPVRRN